MIQLGQINARHSETTRLGWTACIVAVLMLASACDETNTPSSATTTTTSSIPTTTVPLLVVTTTAPITTSSLPCTSCTSTTIPPGYGCTLAVTLESSTEFEWLSWSLDYSVSNICKKEAGTRCESPLADVQQTISVAKCKERLDTRLRADQSIQGPIDLLNCRHREFWPIQRASSYRIHDIQAFGVSGEPVEPPDIRVTRSNCKFLYNASTSTTTLPGPARLYWVGLHTSDTRDIGELTVRVINPAEGQNWQDPDGLGFCEFRIGVDPEVGTSRDALAVTVKQPGGFSGPVEFARCAFESAQRLSLEDFEVRVTRARDASGNPMEIEPEVSISSVTRSDRL